MLQDVYARLLTHQLEPRWVGNELHVDVFGRRFMVGDHPNGVAVRTLTVTAPVVFEEPEEAIAALGL